MIESGTLIRHALGLPATPPVFPLAVAMIEPSFRTLLVAPIGAAPLSSRARWRQPVLQ